MKEEKKQVKNPTESTLDKKYVNIPEIEIPDTIETIEYYRQTDSEDEFDEED